MNGACEPRENNHSDSLVNCLPFRLLLPVLEFIGSSSIPGRSFPVILYNLCAEPLSRLSWSKAERLRVYEDKVACRLSAFQSRFALPAIRDNQEGQPVICLPHG